MKKIAATFIFVICLFMAMIIMPSYSHAAIELDVKMDNAGYFEGAVTDLLMTIGDFASIMINSVIGEKVAINSIVFNHVDAFNPNFFDKTLEDTTETTKTLRTLINEWYTFFTILAVVVYLVVFLVIGTKIVLGSTAGGLASMKEIIIKWITGVMLLFLFPNVVVRYAFQLNEAIVGMLETYTVGYGANGTTIGTTEGEWSNEEIEKRSPEYVSRFTGSSNFGGYEVNVVYQKSLDKYRSGLDLARIMRAYAGITRKLIYAILWFILFGQLVVFVMKYYKRYFIIALLMIIFPLVAMYYIIENARGKPGQVFGAWAKEMFVNIFIQSIHASVYVVIASVALQRVQEDLAVNVDHMNWILAVVAINFISEGEKILRKLLGLDANSVSGVGDTGGAIKKGIRSTVGGAKQVGKQFSDKK